MNWLCGTVPGLVAARGTDVAQPALTPDGDGYLASWATALHIESTQLSASGNLIGSPIVIAETANAASSPAVLTAGTAHVFTFSRASKDAGDRVYLWFDEENVPRKRSVRH